MVAVVPKAADDDLVSLGNLRINLANFGVQVKEKPVNLTFHEFELLRVLTQAADRIIQYDSLCQMLWHSTGAREKRRLNVIVCRLRSKLEASWPYRVSTVRGRGYGLIAEQVNPA
jgi:two-component system alkaline phosphatase synthesis response regulator PhoP